MNARESATASQDEVEDYVKVYHDERPRRDEKSLTAANTVSVESDVGIAGSNACSDTVNLNVNTGTGPCC